MGGMFAVIGVQAALRERERSGRGQFVKSALFESATFLMAQHMAGEVVTGTPAVQMSDRNRRQGIWAIYEAFETADDELIFLGLTSNNHWREFWTHFDRQDLIDDPELATNPDRVRNRARFKPIVEECLRRHSVAELTVVFEKMGVPFAPVAKPGDLFDDPHLKAGGHMVDIEFPGGRRAPIPGLPLEMGDHKFGVRNQTPKAGEHTREILDALGLGGDEIDSLGARGIVMWPSEGTDEEY